MPVVETEYEHIVLDDHQVPLIEGTTMKVIELVMETMAFGWSPEELHLNHPYLSLGQIHSALAYYWDHKQELDEDIGRRQQLAEQIRREVENPALVAKFRMLKEQWQNNPAGLSQA
jgi:uncharacterized protein (DUF433 family)